MSATKPQTARLRKLECDECGCIVRMSRAAMLRCGLPSCGCSPVLRPADVEDASWLASMTGCDAHLDTHPGLTEYAEISIRRWARDASGAARMQCGGCRRFIRKINETCGCGFTNDVQGRRNHGAYLGLQSDKERDARGDDWAF